MSAYDDDRALVAKVYDAEEIVKAAMQTVDIRIIQLKKALSQAEDDAKQLETIALSLEAWGRDR